MTLHCIISLFGQSYTYKECTRQDIWAAQQLQRAGKSTTILLLSWAVSITDLHSITLPIPFHVQSRTAAEMWDEEMIWEFLFPYPAHYLQQSKRFIVSFLSLLFNTACSISNFKGKESSRRNRDFIPGLPRSVEQFVLKNRLLLSLNYHMQ